MVRGYGGIHKNSILHQITGSWRASFKRNIVLYVGLQTKITVAEKT